MLTLFGTCTSFTVSTLLVMMKSISFNVLPSGLFQVHLLFLWNLVLAMYRFLLVVNSTNLSLLISVAYSMFSKYIIPPILLYSYCSIEVSHYHSIVCFAVVK